MYLVLLPLSPSAEDVPSISADHLEYLSKSNSYIAKGSVTITFGDVTLTADEMQIDGNTYDAVAAGNVIYRDPDATMNADRLELNLKTKLGTLYDSYTFYKKYNFHLRSGEIRKVGDKTFILDEATITTCEADPPEWHVSSRDVSITQHESIQGKHGTFNIRDVPVLYTPYFWASLNTDRKTGFLFPSFGYSSTRGSYYKQGFFWAIKENQDATVYLDYYDELGFGEGLDYRYILSPAADGEVWLYHVRDKDPSRTLAEMKSYHNQKLPHDISAYLKIHAVTNYDYYEVMDSTSQDRFGLSSWDSTKFGIVGEERLQKYLESNLEISKQYDSGRIYLLAQGRQSLETSSSDVPQSLPEIGFILNTQSKKLFSFDMSVKGVNFWREKGQEGMRVDIDPTLYFSYGRLLNLTQKIGVRETLYFLREPDEYDDRFIYDLTTELTTTLLKKYSSFVHTIEPSLAYTFIPDVSQDEVPIFDSTDFIPETSTITFALTNRISGIGPKKLEARFRLSQSYNFLGEDDHLSPLVAEGTMSSTNLDASINASYDVDDDIVREFIGAVRLKGKRGYIGVGKNLRRSTDLDQYTFQAGISRPINIINKSLPIDLRGTVWYDAKNRRTQQFNIAYSYTRQCWGYSVTYKDRPGEYQIVFALQFTGLGTFSLGSIGEDIQEPTFSETPFQTPWR